MCQQENITCNCPLSFNGSFCDCSRSLNKEFFWNGTNCKEAYDFNQTCTNSLTSYMCQTLTQGTICRGNTCQCSSMQYFDMASSKCENFLTINSTCFQVEACDVTLGLGCQNDLCQCNSTSQFWSIYNQSCIDYLTYNSGTCTADNQCLGNLTCQTSGSSCACPILTNNQCDCPSPSFGNEYYWNGYTCTPALAFNQSCSANYMCQALTQGTICSGPGSNICQCSSSQYFNFVSNSCENLLGLNSLCTQLTPCNTGNGLVCQNGVCVCGSTNATLCSLKFSYDAGPCSSNSDCSSN